MPFASSLGVAAIAAPLIGGVLGADASKSAANTQANAANNANALNAQQFNVTQGNLSPYLNTGKVALGDLSTLLGLKGSTASLDSNPQFAQFRQAQMAQADAAHQAQYGFSINDPRSGWSAPGEKDKWEQGIRQQFMQQNPSADGSNDPRFGSLLKPFGAQDFQESPAYQFNLDQGRKAIDKASAARGTYYAPQTLQDISKFSQGLASNEFQNAFNNYNTGQNNIFSRLQNVSGSGQNAAVQQGGFGQNFANTAGNNMLQAGNAQAAGMVGGANALSGGLGGAYNNYMLQQILGRNQTPTYNAQTSSGGGFYDSGDNIFGGVAPGAPY